MKTVKSLLLGSAAAFVALTGAQAADLPLAEPVEYVKVCSTYGEGFFYIPGTETCLQISGKVRVDMNVNLSGDDDDDLVGGFEDDDFTTRARGVIAADVRSETEWGTLRSYAEYEFNSDSGEYDDGDTSGIELIAGFIQFAGITAGKAPSFYDFVEYDTVNDFFSSEDVWTFAYTASFGSGFAATIGVEDKYYRANPFSYFLDEIEFDDGPLRFLDQVWPNVIAALRVDQAWGSAQISAAVQDNVGDRDELTPPFAETEDDIGWAVQAGVKFNLPFANEGSYFVIQGAYSEGATSYAGGEEDVGFGAGDFIFADQSYNIDSDTTVNNELWQVGGGIGVQASETVRMNLVGTYAEFTDNGDTGGDIANFSADFILVEGNIFWTPVNNLDLGVAVLYGDVDFVDPVLEDTHDVRITGRIERGF